MLQGYSQKHQGLLIDPPSDESLVYLGFYQSNHYLSIISLMVIIYLWMRFALQYRPYHINSAKFCLYRTVEPISVWCRCFLML